MNNELRIYMGLLSMAILISCNGQPHKNQTRETPIKAKQKAIDFDPYHTPTIDVVSDFGPTNITRSVIQDKTGNIWLATWEGIIRYDGKEFINFTNKEGLRPHRVFSIMEDSNDNIWFGTIGAGLYLYDGKTFVNITTKDGLVNDDVTSIYEDRTGKIWFSTQIGISVWDGEQFQNYTTKDGLTNDDVNSIVEDQNGTMWIGTRGEACKFDGKQFTKLTNNDGSSFYNVRTIIEDQDGSIWFGGNDGLWRSKKDVLTNYTKNFVGYIYEDSVGNIWTSAAATGNSHEWILSRYAISPPPFNEISEPTLLSTDQSEMLFGIVEDSQGDMWIGSVNGVYRYDGTRFHDFRDKSGSK